MSAAFIDDEVGSELRAQSFLEFGWPAGGADCFPPGRGAWAQGDDPFGIGFSDGDPEAEALVLGALQGVDGKMTEFSESHAGESEQQQGVGVYGIGALEDLLEGEVDVPGAGVWAAARGLGGRSWYRSSKPGAGAWGHCHRTRSSRKSLRNRIFWMRVAGL